MTDAEVAVVGGGFAGLAAADRLARSGRRVIVLEARDRVGGRSRSDRFDDGSWIDAGGQWLGPGHERMYALARRFGKTVWPMYVAGKNVLHRRGQRGLYKGTIPFVLPPAALANLAWAFAALEWQSRRVPLDTPWKAANAEALDRQTFGDWMRRHLPNPDTHFLIEIVAETVFACHPDDLSLLHALFYFRSNAGVLRLTSSAGGAQQDRVEGGTQPIAASLAEAVIQAGSQVMLDAPVRAIRDEGGEAVIESDAGTVRARQVIVATPPVLTREMDFAPGLPENLRSWMDGTPPGRVIKCFAFYDRPFWREAGLSGSAVGDQGPLKTIFDGTPPTADHAILCGFIEARDVDEWREKSMEARGEAVLACLERFFGPEALNATRYVDHCWVDEAWSRGCYAGMSKPGVVTKARVDFTHPFGRVHWAGTETASRWNGYLEGAVRSGERAADAVMRSLSSSV